MYSGRISLSLIVSLLIGAGCKKSQPPPSPPAATSTNSSTTLAVPKDTLAQIHWVGKKQVAADTNSHDLMAVWNLPESTKLEAQTLEKLSTAPWRLFHLEVDTNASSQLRPLVNDLLQEESYLEIRG